MSGGKNRPGSNRSRKKRMLLERDGARCYLCGDACSPDHLTLDHKIPYSRGGSNHVNNLALSCYPCNQAKGDMTVDEYLGLQPDKTKEKGLTHALSDYFPR